MEKNVESAEDILDELDKSDSENQFIQEQYIFLSRKMRIYIFILFLILSVAVDLEYGIFNSSVDYVQKDLNIEQFRIWLICLNIIHRENNRFNNIYVLIKFQT